MENKDFVLWRTLHGTSVGHVKKIDRFALVHTMSLKDGTLAEVHNSDIIKVYPHK